MSDTTTTRDIRRLIEGRLQPVADQLAVEEPLEIRIDGRATAVTMRTPGHDDELAAGFCLTEGVIQSSQEIESIEPCRIDDYGNVVNVRLHPGAAQNRSHHISAASRQNYVSSSCGLCGKETIDRIRQRLAPIRDDLRVNAALLSQSVGRMREAQPTFDATGGLHASALFSPQGELLVLREDIGRHNALDKVIGAALIARRLPLHDAWLLVSGRAGFELVQKAAVAGIPLLAAVGAPSSLAVDLAREAGMTLVGFLRHDRMNIYAHERRIVT